MTNTSADWSCLVLTGPKSRAILSAICDADLDAPWLNHQNTTISGVPTTAMRVSYVGELGWELHMPLADVCTVFNTLWAAGESYGLRPFGMYAMDSMRIEKGYRSRRQT